jgi:hypothetical protein
VELSGAFPAFGISPSAWLPTARPLSKLSGAHPAGVIGGFQIVIQDGHEQVGENASIAVTRAVEPGDC